MDYFDPFGEPDAAARLREVRTRFLLVSFSSDWRFGTPHTRFIAEQLEVAGVDVTAHEVDSPFGHDSFLFAMPGVPPPGLSLPGRGPRRRSRGPGAGGVSRPRGDGPHPAR